MHMVKKSKNGMYECKYSFSIYFLVRPSLLECKRRPVSLSYDQMNNTTTWDVAAHFILPFLLAKKTSYFRGLIRNNGANQSFGPRGRGGGGGGGETNIQN